MWAIEHHPQIKMTDFDTMRAHYKDYLRSKWYDDEYIAEYLHDFDVARQVQNYSAIYDLMIEIGVDII